MNEKSLKMRTMPVGKLIFTMSLPAMFSMLIQALYNVVDTIYVSRISDGSSKEINALGFAFPIQMILMGIALGIGIGTSSLVARKLGEKRKEEASIYATTGVIMAFIGGLIMLVLSFLVVNPYFKISTNDDYTYTCGTQYLKIVMLFSLGSFLEITLTKILQGTGRMIIPMIAQLIGALTNIILDPIMIFNMGLGVKGAAIATVVGQWASFVFVLIVYLITKLDIKITIKHFRFRKDVLMNILKVGLPTAIMNSISSFTNLVVNALLKYLDSTETAIGILSIYFKLQSFVFMPVFGLNQGGLPILSYNFGSNDYSRFKKASKILLTTSFSIMIIGTLIFQFFGKYLLILFDMSSNQDAITCLRIVSFSFIPASIGVIISMMFQAIGKGLNSLLMTLVRQAIGLIPAALLLTFIFKKVSAIWFAYPFSELLSISIFIPIIIKNVKKAFNEKNIILGNS